MDGLIALKKALTVAKSYTDDVAKALAGGLKYLGSVANKSSLPLSNNKLGYMYTTSDDGHEHVWTKDAAAGTINDWLDLNKDLENFYKKTEVDALLLSLKTELTASMSDKLTKLPNVDDPSDPGYGYPYWIPYNFSTSVDADKVDITLKTLTLDNNLLKHEFINSFPVATTTTAGTMSAADKSKLDNVFAIYDTRISDANSWLTNGYAKTSADIPTTNLPSVCVNEDRWGVLFYAAENNENHAGLQQYFPIDGTYKGRVFYRSVTGYSSTTPPEFGDWNLVAWSAEKQDIISDLDTIRTGASAGSTAVQPAQLGGITLKPLTQAEYDALAVKDASTLYIIK